MNWKFALFVFVVSIIISCTCLSMSSENSFLDASGGRDAAKQKLMVVDQSTGEISFVNKSLAGINKNFTDEDNDIKNALKNLLGDNMNNYGGYTKTGNDGVLAKMAAADQARRAHEDEKYATKTELADNKKVDDERVQSLETSLKTRYIKHGDLIQINTRTAEGGVLTNVCGWQGGHNCDVRFMTGRQNATYAEDPHGTGHYISLVWHNPDT